MKAVEIHVRSQHLVNTDPQRRCYNGCHFSSKLQWSGWEHLETCPEDKIKQRLGFWVDLNDYAVSQRGKSAKREFMTQPA
jgi:hypothetical protein